MPCTRLQTLPLATAALLVALAGAASAAPPTLASLCPQAETELNAALTSVLQEVGQDDQVRVQFTVAGSQVHAVRTEGGSLRYQHALRRAVLGLQCNSAEASAQRLALTVRFASPGAAGAREAPTRLAGASAPAP